MELLYRALTWVLLRCYTLCGNFGLAILLFTLLPDKIAEGFVQCLRYSRQHIGTHHHTSVLITRELAIRDIHSHRQLCFRYIQFFSPFGNPVPERPLKCQCFLIITFAVFHFLFPFRPREGRKGQRTKMCAKKEHRISYTTGNKPIALLLKSAAPLCATQGL